MSRLHAKYLLVGGGAASSAAAMEIRRRDVQGALLVVGQEINRPYYRSPLSGSYLRGQAARESLFAVEPSWYGQNGVTLRTGQRAVHLDTTRSLVILDNGEEISFDRLLIATGATPAHLTIPGADLPGVYYLHNLEDADRLRHAVDQARQVGRPHRAAREVPDLPPPAPRQYESAAEAAKRIPRGRAVIVGADRLGVELAASLAQLGIEVELLATGPHPWADFAGESVGRFISSFLECRGIRVHSACAPLRFEGDGRVQRVVIPAGAASTASQDYTLDCDFAVAAVGMWVHKDLLRGTSISAEKAILIDESCRTNISGIFAAGDCAAILDPPFGKHSLCEHWDSAAVTGALAGANMAASAEDHPGAAAASARYEGAGSFTSEVFDLSVTAWGEARFVTRRLLRGSSAAAGTGAATGSAAIAPPNGALIEFGIDAAGRVAQVLALEGGPAAREAASRDRENDLHPVLREIVLRRLNVAGREEQIKDPAVGLASLNS